MNKPTRTPKKKPCRPSRSVLDAILDGVEDHASRATLEAHARDCEACEHALLEALSMRSMLEALVDSETTRVDDQAFVASVFAGAERIETSKEDVSEGPDTASGRPWRWMLLGSAAAAAAALLVMQQGGRGGAREHPRTDGRSAELHPSSPAMTPEENPASTSPPGDIARDPTGAGTTPAAQDSADVAPPALTTEEIEGFRMALKEAAAAADFDPRSQESPGRFIAAVESSLDDPRRAARKILASVSAASAAGDIPAEAPLAARFLGPRADARDRLLLKRSVAELGSAGAWALADRGRPGFTALWSLGLTPLDDDDARSSDAGVSARSVLFAAAKDGRLDLDGLPRTGADAALAAAVITAGSSDSADRLLGLFLGSGETPWLDAWAGTEGAADSLAAELAATRGARTGGRRAERLVMAVGRSGAASGITFTLDALGEGVKGSAAALAAIEGTDPVLALFDATQSGVLLDSAEEVAWAAMVRSGARRVLGVTLRDGFMANERAELLLDALVRGAGPSLHPEEQRALGGLCASPDLFSETRGAALLLLAEKCAPGGTRLLPELKGTIARLRTDADALVCAAAWLVPIEASAPAPAHVARVLSRSGSVTVKHARLTRAIEKARERLARGSF